MSVTLNEVGIRALFANPEGPVGRMIQERALAVQLAAQQNVEDIMHRNPATVFNAIGVSLREGEDGIEAVVGIRPGGSVSEYLDEKAAAPKEGTESWMLRAMGTAFF